MFFKAYSSDKQIKFLLIKLVRICIFPSLSFKLFFCRQLASATDRFARLLFQRRIAQVTRDQLLECCLWSLSGALRSQVSRSPPPEFQFWIEMEKSSSSPWSFFEFKFKWRNETITITSTEVYVFEYNVQNNIIIAFQLQSL